MADVKFKDFTKPRDAITFQVDGDTFEAVPAVGLPTIQTATTLMGEGLTAAGQIEKLVNLFGDLLTVESAARFRDRLNSKTEPIDFEQLTDILMWLLECYGLRPTEPSSDSSESLPGEATGTGGADGALPEESTP